MNYDQNMKYGDSQAENQDELWLEDLKALLDEEPGPNVGRGPAGPVSGYGAPAPVPPQMGQGIQPGIPDNRNFRGAPQGIPQAGPRRPDLQGTVWNFPSQQRGSAVEWQGNVGTLRDEEMPRKKSYLGAVITLSIIILLELLAIGGVAYTWMQWMQ